MTQPSFRSKSAHHARLSRLISMLSKEPSKNCPHQAAEPKSRHIHVRSLLTLPRFDTGWQVRLPQAHSVRVPKVIVDQRQQRHALPRRSFGEEISCKVW